MIEIKVIGDKEGVDRMLDALDTALNPVAIAGFLGAVVDPYLRQRASNRFRQEGDDVTGSWAPLQESTQNIREQSGFGAAHPINRRTGELEAYITESPNKTTIHPWGASLTLPGTPPVGALKDKVETAQKGRAWPATVARPVLGMNEKDLIFVLLALAGHIERVGKAMI